VKDKGPICYIGKKDDTYYPILPHDFDSKRYLLRKGVYERQPFCVIHETEWPRNDSDGESSVKSSVLDEDGNGEDIDKDIDDAEDNDNSNKDHVEQVVQENHMTEGDQDGEAIDKEVLAADAMSAAEAKDIEEEVAQDEPMGAEIRESHGKDNTVINDAEQMTEVDVVTQQQSMMTDGDQDGEAIEKEVLRADAMSAAEAKDIEEEVVQDGLMGAEIKESHGKDNAMINDAEQMTEVDVVTQQQSMMVFKKKNLHEMDSNEGQPMQVQELVGNTTLEAEIDKDECLHDNELESDGKDLSPLSNQPSISPCITNSSSFHYARHYSMM